MEGIAEDSESCFFMLLHQLWGKKRHYQMHSKIGQIICSSQYSVIKLFIYIQQLVLFRTNHIIIWKLLNTMLSPLVL